MRKRKLYLSELIKRNRNADTHGIIVHDKNDKTFYFNSFNDIEKIYLVVNPNVEVKVWTYSENLGYILIIK